MLSIAAGEGEKNIRHDCRIFCRKRRERKADAGSQALFVHLLNFFFDFSAFIRCEISHSALLDRWSIIQPEENFVEALNPSVSGDRRSGLCPSRSKASHDRSGRRIPQGSVLRRSSLWPFLRIRRLLAGVWCRSWSPRSGRAIGQPRECPRDYVYRIVSRALPGNVQRNTAFQFVTRGTYQSSKQSCAMADSARSPMSARSWSRGPNAVLALKFRAAFLAITSGWPTTSGQPFRFVG